MCPPTPPPPAARRAHTAPRSSPRSRAGFFVACAAAAAVLGSPTTAGAHGAGGSGAEPTALPTYVNTPQGWLHVENTYVPGVTHSELGWFAGQQRRGRRSECLKAQAIAARTYLLRWLNAHGHTRRIPALDGRFQAWTSRFNSHSRAAAQAVHGQVMTYQGKVIFANYASGAFPLGPDGFPYAPSRYGYPASYTWDTIRQAYIDRKARRISASTYRSRVTRYNRIAWTYILNTDNEGRTGSAVRPTLHARNDVRNRGGLGQYRAWWLDRYRDYDYARILRAFYGADVTIVGGPNPATTPGAGSSPPPATAPPARPPSAAPNLVVRALVTRGRNGDDSLIAAGETVSFRAVIRNTGADMTRRVPIVAEVRVEGSLVARLGATLQLRSGESASLSQTSGGWAPGNPGNYRIEVRVDTTAAVREQRENDNALTVRRPVATAYEVTAGALNVRTGPSTRYRRVGLVRRGQRYVALERRGNWVRIDLRGGVSGWCHAGYLRPAGRVTVEQIAVRALNVRTGPSTRYRRIGVVRAGQFYVRRGRRSGWPQIDYNGGSGWCSGRYTTSLEL
ncbi:MAG: hypothetical protein D6776_11630 [Planctomycetota bacterium]|nr:MAG: hypothetical protein D6776_11630 [Planctomycetota bacterium]